MRRRIGTVLALLAAMMLLTACGGKRAELPETGKTAEETQKNRTEAAETERETEREDETPAETAATEEPQTEAPVIVNNEQVVVEMENCFAEELDYIVPEEELDPSAMMTNAILKKTTVTVNVADENWCDVTICYPNALDILLEVSDALPEDAGWDQIDEAYEQIAAIIESDQVEMLEENFILQVTKEYDIYDIVWTDEAINALTGGLYLIGME